VARELTVRGTPVRMLEHGEGPPLLFLHGAGTAGRWLPFQAALARRFTLFCPSHPGHGGSPPADWIQHVSDLAFHYLDLCDELRLPEVHLAGASFGGWIAAEVATMAEHRLRSLVLIDPVGIKVDGWIYPFLFAMDLPQLVGNERRQPGTHAGDDAALRGVRHAALPRRRARGRDGRHRAGHSGHGGRARRPRRRAPGRGVTG
jgi:pimeloyl-ACP methyl ester carboxylesterase